jgi:hypothetical protein
VFKHNLAKKTLAARKGQESKVLLPAEYHDWARARAEQQIGAIKASGAQVVGDLDELRPVLRDSSDVQTVATEPDADAVLDAAVQALAAVALDTPRRKKRAAAASKPKPAAPREGVVRRARLDWLDRVRGRSAKDLTAAALRRVRRAPRSET